MQNFDHSTTLKCYSETSIRQFEGIAHSENHKFNSKTKYTQENYDVGQIDTLTDR